MRVHTCEEVLFLPFSEESRKLTRLLFSETSIRILEALGENCLSASELSARLNLRLNTLQYHLNSLLEADLIRISEVKWSRKGRKIKVYSPVEKMIILIPGRGSVSRVVLFDPFRECMGGDPGPCTVWAFH
ncbi:TPA: winged helix-turn-helix transcriptional regulator [Methanosarcina acetivorans]|nr:winged helix-turn-helix transcriptional regulator [Methanosarcina acetivorans]